MTVKPPYEYRAVVDRVVDGDTVILDVSLGFGMWLLTSPKHPVSFRLLGLNAIELRNPGGKESRDHLAELLPAGTEVVIRSVAVDKYGGRYDVVIFRDGVNINELLIATGWAAYWDGRGTAPVPPWPIPAATS